MSICLTVIALLGSCTSLSNYRSAFGPEGPQVFLATSNAAQPLEGGSTSVVPEGEVRIPVNRTRSLTVGVKAFPGGASLDWQYTPYQEEPVAAAVDLAVDYTQEGSDLFGGGATRYVTVAPGALATYRPWSWLETTIMLRMPVTIESGGEVTPLLGGNLTAKIGENLGLVPQGGLYFDPAGGTWYLNAGVALFATFAQR